MLLDVEVKARVAMVNTGDPILNGRLGHVVGNIGDYINIVILDVPYEGKKTVAFPNVCCVEISNESK